MNCFRNLKLKHTYDSGVDNILEEFYIPVLRVAKRYQRMCGFFSSTSLAIAAKGIIGLIKNKGEMKLITSPIFSKEDINAIIDGYTNLQMVIEKRMLKELSSIDNVESLEDILRKDHVRALSWLIANGRLEIKVVVVVDEHGLPLDDTTIMRYGIFHHKVGILEDSDGDIISFSGSINETATGWLYNLEEFKVFRSWIAAEKPYVKSDIERFRRYWSGAIPIIKVMDVPDAVKQQFIKIAPKSLDELETLSKFYEGRLRLKRPRFHVAVKPKRFQLYKFQEEALQKWFENSCMGILEMATGAGKTIIAIEGLDRLFRQENKLIVVISVPYKHLIDQWIQKIRLYGLSVQPRIIMALGDNPEWDTELEKEILSLEFQALKKTLQNFCLIVLTTHVTLASEKFIDIIDKVTCAKILLIADEVHWLGAPKLRRGLIDKYTFRLGLSATPLRWFDHEGTEYLKNYFVGVVYRFSISDAIREDVLVPYEYWPIIVELDEEEVNEYIKLTSHIAQQIARIEKNETLNDEEYELLTNLLNKRAAIVKSAKSKLKQFKDLIERLMVTNKLKYCIIYCMDEQQLKKVAKILHELDLVYSRFTGRESLEERIKILESFRDGTIQILLAMRCLDEGVDVPPARMAIILASTTNPREFIQRRGRLLRRAPGKKKSTIYDFVVIVPPRLALENDRILKMERAILRRELARMHEFAKDAFNSEQALKKIRYLQSVFQCNF